MHVDCQGRSLVPQIPPHWAPLPGRGPAPLHPGSLPAQGLSCFLPVAWGALCPVVSIGQERSPDRQPSRPGHAPCPCPLAPCPLPSAPWPPGPAQQLTGLDLRRGSCSVPSGLSARGASCSGVFAEQTDRHSAVTSTGAPGHRCPSPGASISLAQGSSIHGGDWSPHPRGAPGSALCCSRT